VTSEEQFREGLRLIRSTEEDLNWALGKAAAPTILGEGCIIGEGATVSHSILWARAHVEPQTHLYRCLVGFDCKVYSDAAIFDATIVSPHSRNGD
jgi:NDP-sugar pyrophosphorylase family protein